MRSELAEQTSPPNPEFRGSRESGRATPTQTASESPSRVRSDPDDVLLAANSSDNSDEMAQRLLSSGKL